MRNFYENPEDIKFKGTKGPWIAVVERVNGLGMYEDYCSNNDPEVVESEQEAFENIYGSDYEDYKEYDTHKLGITPYESYYQGIAYDEDNFLIGTELGGTPKEHLNELQEDLFDYESFYNFKLMASAPDLLEIAKNALIFIDKFREECKKDKAFDLESLFDRYLRDDEIYCTLIRATEFNKKTTL